MSSDLKPVASPLIGITNFEPRATIHSALLVFSILASVAASGFAFVLRCASGTAMYDFNFPVFRNVLTPMQQEGIVRTVAALMDSAIIPLVLACVFANVTGFLLLRDVRRLQACKRTIARE